jgi:hypothetical protein
MQYPSQSRKSDKAPHSTSGANGVPNGIGTGVISFAVVSLDR